jgi:hypothetical protein
MLDGLYAQNLQYLLGVWTLLPTRLAPSEPIGILWLYPTIVEYLQYPMYCICYYIINLVVTFHQSVILMCSACGLDPYKLTISRVINARYRKDLTLSHPERSSPTDLLSTGLA